METKYASTLQVVRDDIDGTLIARTAKLYEAMALQADLSPRSTFSLLASFTLIGLCLASAKPQTVQVLGFTIQADHWLWLAMPLALVVGYAAVQLLLVWMVERRRFKYVVLPLHVMIGEEVSRRLAELQKQIAGMASEAMAQAVERTVDSECRLQPDNLGNAASELAILAADECLESNAAKQAVHERTVDDLASEIAYLSRMGKEMLLSTQLNKVMTWIGLVIPLLVALVSFVVLGAAVY